MVAAEADPALALLRRLPPVGGLAPPPQRLAYGAVATYRVRLAGAPGDPYAGAPCAGAALPDAAP